MANPVLQASADTPTRSVSGDGLIRTGTITKIHSKRYTAEVVFDGSGEQQKSDSHQEGENGCEVAVTIAGYSEKYSEPYGEIIPFKVGERVVVGMVGTEKGIILGKLHFNGEQNGDNNFANILPFTNDKDSLVDEWIKVYPNQDFQWRNEQGDTVNYQSNHSFFYCKEGYISPDYTTYEDLPYRNYKALVPSIKEQLFKTKCYLWELASKFNSKVSNYVKVFANSAKSTFKIIQQINKTVSYLRFHDDGSIALRRQLDTVETEADYPSAEFAEICITKDKAIVLQVCGANGHTIIKINDSGILINSDGKMDTKLTGDYTIQSEGQFKWTSTGNANLTSESDIVEKASMIYLN